MQASYRRLKTIILIVPILITITLAALTIILPKPSRVIMVGLDAADWDIINPLLDAGRLPNIQKIVDDGVTGKLQTFEISASPAVWTTISTGVERKTHGIGGFLVPGMEDQPYNSEMRRVPAIWNILSEYNKHVGIVGHWVSWPAEEINGEMVSAYISYDPDESRRVFYKGKLREEANIPGQTYPPELIDELEPFVVTEKDITKADLNQFFHINNWDDKDLYALDLAEALNYVVPWTYAADLTHKNVFDYLRKNKSPYDYLFTFIECTDSFAHRFYLFHDTTYLEDAMKHWGYDLNLKDKYIEAFGDSLNLAYVWADEYIGEVMADMGPRDTLVVVSDHGFGPYRGSDRGNDSNFELNEPMHTFSGDHATYGVIMLYGANVKKGYKLKGPPPNLTDVMPTVLVLMKVPIAKYVEGRPVWDAVDPLFASTYREQWVDSYGIEQNFGKQSAKSPLDWELIRRLKSLGYLQ